MQLDELRRLCAAGEYIVSQHALIRCAQRDIDLDDVRRVIMEGEVIEDYPDDPRSPSCLMLAILGYPLHVVAGIRDECAWVITTYVPTLDKWESDYKTRRVNNNDLHQV